MMDNNNDIIENLLGQTNAFESIIKKKSVSSKCLIYAPTGFGKHYLIEKLEKHYQGCSGVCPVCLSSNSSGLLKVQDFTPFLNMLSSRENIIYTNISSLGKSFATLIPYLGKVISQALSHKKVYPAIFSNAEIELLARIEHIAGTKQIIFLCENIDVWDQPSISFLNKLFSHTIGIRKASFICTSSSKEQTPQILSFDSSFELHPIPKEYISHVVDIILPDHSLGFSTLEKIHMLSGGNIGIIKQLCNLVVDNGTRLINESSTYHSITLQRLHGLLNDIKYQQTVGLIDHASIIGERMYKRLLQDFSKLDLVEFAESIAISKENNILIDEVNSLVFNSREVWQAFNSVNIGNKHFHFELANCLQKLMPSNLYYIGNELLLAGQEKEACVFIILALLNDYHSYRVIPTILPAQIKLLENNDLYNSYLSLTRLYTLYFAGKFDELQQTACKFDDYRLTFESDYIHALSSINGSIKHSDYTQALNKLDSWIEDEKFIMKCPYQWMRAAILALSVKYELHDTSMQSLLKKIEITKRQYIDTDKGIERLEFDFLAKCNFCYSIDTAYIYTKQAAEYFKKTLKQSPSAYPYFISLINSSANSLVTGKYSEAIEYSLSALELVDNGYSSFGATDAIINNLLLAGLLKGELSNDEIDRAIDQLANVASSISEDIITKILLRNNIAVMMCYKGDFASAAELINKLYDDLQFTNDIDDYYSYIVGNNYCILCLLTSNTEFDFQKFETLCQLQPLYHDRSYFESRNQYVLDYLRSNRFIDTAKPSWNDFKSQKVGPAWSFWGKWLLFSDIQIWSD